MFELMNDMPEAQMQFEASKEAVIKKLESDWTTGSSVYWSYERAQNLGVNYDMNEKVYQQIQNITLDDIKMFFNEHIMGKQYSICVIGDKTKMDMKVLGKLGEVKELDLVEIFGY